MGEPEAVIDTALPADTPLVAFFRELWGLTIEGMGFDGGDVVRVMQEAGLVREWPEAESMLVLSDAGKAALRLGPLADLAGRLLAHAEALEVEADSRRSGAVGRALMARAADLRAAAGLIAPAVTVPVVERAEPLAVVSDGSAAA